MLILKARKQFSPYKYVVFAGVLVLASFAHLPVSAAEDLDQKGLMLLRAMIAQIGVLITVG